MDHPKISIITVVFNGAEYIGRTIASVAGQTYEHIEYIIIDGKSTDNTLEVIAGFGGVDLLISETDRGLYDAMNKGISAASGDYVWFLNAGDQVYGSHTVETMVSGLEGSPDIIYGGTMIIDRDQKEIGDRRLKPPRELSWKSFRRGMVVCHQSLIVKRELAPQYNLEYRLSSDFDWAIRALKAARLTHNSHMILSRFLEGGLTEQNIRAGLRERFVIMRRFYGFIPTLLRHFLFGARLARYFLIHRRI